MSTIVLSIVSAVISGTLVAGATFFLQRKQSHEFQRLELKVKSYQDYISAVTDNIGRHGDGTYKTNPELGNQDRYKIARYRAVACSYASSEALKKMEEIALAAEPNKPLADLADQLTSFVMIVRRECFRDESVAEKELRSFLPFSNND